MTDLDALRRMLFRPFDHGALHLANRVVMAPMTRWMSPDNVPGADVAAYYRRRAENGVGLIITEGTFVAHPGAGDSDRIPNFHGEAALAGWKAVVDGVHEAGGAIMPQLWHVGLVAQPKEGAARGTLTPHQVGPSGLAGGLGIRPYPDGRPMTGADMEAVAAGFVESALAAQRLGFDGVELHGAHGYIFDQFFWDETNRREDGYGGPLANRARFAAEVIRAIKQATGPGFPLVLRISQWKQHDYRARLATTPAMLEELLLPLVDAGVDLFHCSQRRFWEPEFEGSPMNLAGWAKAITGRPSIAVGSIGLEVDFLSTMLSPQASRPGHLDELAGMMERGDLDLAAVGRALLVDPAWARKIERGEIEALIPYTPEALGTLS